MSIRRRIELLELLIAPPPVRRGPVTVAELVVALAESKTSGSPLDSRFGGVVANLARFAEAERKKAEA